MKRNILVYNWIGSEFRNIEEISEDTESRKRNVWIQMVQTSKMCKVCRTFIF